MRVLVTGQRGQLVSSLVERARAMPQIEVITAGRPELELLDRASVIGCIAHHRPDIVISAAAYTAVDRAEDEAHLAYAVNVTGAASVAEAADKVGAAIIHISTDYVFSGNALLPYREDSATGPTTVYGWTKLEGEHAVARLNPRHFIVRTSWVYGPFGSNFVRTILGLAARQDAIQVVCDQWGNPTSALDLADALLHIAVTVGDDRFGTYHLAGKGDINWSGLARHVLDVSRTKGGPFAEIVDIPTHMRASKARRPSSSRLCTDKVSDAFGLRPPDWQSSTCEVVSRLMNGPGNG